MLNARIIHKTDITFLGVNKFNLFSDDDLVFESNNRNPRPIKAQIPDAIISRVNI